MALLDNNHEYSTEDPPIYNSPKITKIPLMLAIAFCGGLLIGAFVLGKNDISVASNQRVTQNADKFKDIISYIDRYYVDTVDIDNLTEHAIEEMLVKLDPHTSYIPARDYELVSSSLEGEFVGVGIEYNIFNDTIHVVNTISGGPSEKAGLQGGDKIVAVDGKRLAAGKLTSREIVDLLRGERGTKVEITVIRIGAQEPLKYTVTRDKITTSSVDIAYMLDDVTGYLKINRFGAKTDDEFFDSLDKLQSKGMERLILDLRDNGGGYLDKAIKIADAFLPNKQTIVYTRSKEESFDENALAKGGGEFESGGLIVLINEYSASASEIVAGALQDNDRALIVGRRSFGKGLVQRPISLDDGSSLRLTISRYYTPSGRSIQKPYADTLNYQSDINDRYTNGEFFSADSIDFDPSLEYKTTVKGRSVYGGGGIMPDFFVPLDTSGYTPLYRSISGKNLLREFSLHYTSMHKSLLLKMGVKDYSDSFDNSLGIENSFKEYVIQSGVVWNEEDYAKSKELILGDLKALIARNIWKDSGYYPILHESDRTLQKAIKLFDQIDVILAGN